MDTNKSLLGNEGVKFDDCTMRPESLTSKLSTTNAYVARKASTIRDFMQTHGKVLRYAAAMSALCLMTNEAYAVDVVKVFTDNIVTPIHTIAHDNYGKGIAVLAGGYMLISEGADMRTKATRAGIGALFAYGLGNILFA